MSQKKLPLFLGEGEEQIQIGTAELDLWKSGFTKVMLNIDVFPGEYLGFSRVINWEEVVTYANSRYNKDWRS